MLFFGRVPSIHPEDAREIISGGGATVIDVRSAKCYKEGHIDRAVFCDKANWAGFINQLDKNKKVICYCYKGISSRAVCRRLMKAGFKDVLNLKGGYDGWKKACG